MESALLGISGADEEDEENDNFCPAFIFYKAMGSKHSFMDSNFARLLAR